MSRRIKDSGYNRSVFTEAVTAGFDKHIKDSPEVKNICGFLNYLLDKSIIDESIINRFAVLSEYERLLPVNKFIQARTVIHVSDVTGVSKTRVESIIRNYYKAYLKKKTLKL